MEALIADAEHDLVIPSRIRESGDSSRHHSLTQALSLILTKVLLRDQSPNHHDCIY